MTKKHKIIGVVLIITVIVLFIYWKNKKRTTGPSNQYFHDYEGDNYEGSKYYVGDKDFYENDRGRKVATAVASSLYKVVEPAYKLKYEYNNKGVKTMIKLSPDNKPDLKRGSQLRIIKSSEEKPLEFNGQNFVQTIFGNFVRLDRIKKIRD
jgi:hypothetical protein